MRMTTENEIDEDKKMKRFNRSKRGLVQHNYGSHEYRLENGSTPVFFVLSISQTARRDNTGG